MRKGLVLLVAVCILLSACTVAESEPILEIRVLEVGQGSSTLVRTPVGDILVDAGGEAEQERLMARLTELGVERLDYLILTHPDEDHIGGADAVVGRLEVGCVWHNGYLRQSESMTLLCRELEKRSVLSVAVGLGDGFSLGDLTVTVLSPETVVDGNAGSLVLRLACMGRTVLIMGDADLTVESELLKRYGAAQLQSELLLAGHHGSNDTCSESFLQAVAPRYTAVSCGSGNSYGFPDGRVLARLEAAGSEILRTDLQGELCIYWTAGAEEPTVISEESKEKRSKL